MPLLPQYCVSIASRRLSRGKARRAIVIGDLPRRRINGSFHPRSNAFLARDNVYRIATTPTTTTTTTSPNGILHEDEICIEGASAGTPPLARGL